HSCVMAGGFGYKSCLQHTGIDALGQLDGSIERWRKPGDLRIFQRPRRMSDDVYERRNAARQERLGVGDQRWRLRSPRARLGDVGTGDFADVKPLLRGAKLL